MKQWNALCIVSLWSCECSTSPAPLAFLFPEFSTICCKRRAHLVSNFKKLSSPHLGDFFPHVAVNKNKQTRQLSQMDTNDGHGEMYSTNVTRLLMKYEDVDINLGHGTASTARKEINIGKGKLTLSNVTLVPIITQL